MATKAEIAEETLELILAGKMRDAAIRVVLEEIQRLKDYAMRGWEEAHRTGDMARQLLLKAEARVRQLEAALREVHGTEPSLNFKDGKPYEYCPLCDDQTWPCAVARLLSQPEAAPKEER